MRKARWLAGMTLEEAATRSGITYRHYAELERGRVNPTMRTMFELARLLGRPVTELVEVGAKRPRVSLADARATPPKRGRKPRP